MKRKKVISSNVEAIGYDADQRILEVEFKNGSVYHYLNVPESKYSGIMSASSKGTYLNSDIKGTYTYEQIH